MADENKDQRLTDNNRDGDEVLDVDPLTGGKTVAQTPTEIGRAHV